MRLETYKDPRSYRKAVFSFLLERESENCLGIGILDTLLHTPKRYKDYHLAAIFDSKNKPILAIWMTPPFPMGITDCPDEAIPELIRYAISLVPRLSGIVGPARPTQLFMKQWMAQTQCEVTSQMNHRIYELSNVIPAANVPGRMRVVSEVDCDLLEKWNRAFTRDCGLPEDPEMAKTIAKAVIDDKSRYFWEVAGVPVSMAGAQGNTPSGIRVSWVYTPPEHRGKGYGSAITAALSQHLLDKGKRLCFLYTDLANPTSNRIYQKIGYVPVSDAAHYEFRYP